MKRGTVSLSHPSLVPSCLCSISIQSGQIRGKIDTQIDTQNTERHTKHIYNKENVTKYSFSIEYPLLWFPKYWCWDWWVSQPHDGELCSFTFLTEWGSIIGNRVKKHFPKTLHLLYFSNVNISMLCVRPIPGMSRYTNTDTG